MATDVPEDARPSCLVRDVGGQPSLSGALRSLASQRSLRDHRRQLRRRRHAAHHARGGLAATV